MRPARAVPVSGRRAAERARRRTVLRRRGRSSRLARPRLVRASARASASASAAGERAGARQATAWPHPAPGAGRRGRGRLRERHRVERSKVSRRLATRLPKCTSRRTTTTRTATEFLQDVGRPQAAEIAAREASEEADARPEAFDGRGCKLARFGALAVEDDGKEGPAGLGELVDDVDAVIRHEAALRLAAAAARGRKRQR
jgi:hypothetical protein